MSIVCSAVQAAGGAHPPQGVCGARGSSEGGASIQADAEPERRRASGGAAQRQSHTHRFTNQTPCRNTCIGTVAVQHDLMFRVCLCGGGLDRTSELQQTAHELQKALDITQHVRQEDHHALQQRDRLIQTLSSDNQQLHRLLQVTNTHKHKDSI